VKVFGAIALVLVVVVALLVLTGQAGDHGPGRHAPRNHNGPPAGITHDR
jgi:hypothetical protein